MYSFSANAGDRYYFDSQGRSGEIYWRLIDPLGNLVFDRTSMNTDVQDVAALPVGRPVAGSITPTPWKRSASSCSAGG